MRLIYTDKYTNNIFKVGEPSMQKSFFLFVLFTAAVISGCATKMPLNANEFRQMAPGATFGGKETYEVNRSVKRGANTLIKRADMCLN